jgi:hypothetical protein
MDGVNWIEVGLNACISSLVAIVVAAYVRFKVKPKHEEVFEHNRTEEIIRIFSTIDLVDLHIGEVFDLFETNLGIMTPDRVTVVPRPEFIQQSDGSHIATISLEDSKLRREFESLKPRFAYHYEILESYSNAFKVDYQRLLNHIESNFLGTVSDYIFNTVFFTECLIKDSLLPSLLEKRKHSARKIIDFLNNDKTIPTDDKRIKDFIERWENRC